MNDGIASNVIVDIATHSYQLVCRNNQNSRRSLAEVSRARGESTL